MPKMIERTIIQDQSGPWYKHFLNRLESILSWPAAQLFGASKHTVTISGIKPRIYSAKDEAQQSIFKGRNLATQLVMGVFVAPALMLLAAVGSLFRAIIKPLAKRFDSTAYRSSETLVPPQNGKRPPVDRNFLFALRQLDLDDRERRELEQALEESREAVAPAPIDRNFLFALRQLDLDDRERRELEQALEESREAPLKKSMQTAV